MVQNIRRESRNYDAHKFFSCNTNLKKSETLVWKFRRINTSAINAGSLLVLLILIFQDLRVWRHKANHARFIHEKRGLVKWDIPRMTVNPAFSEGQSGIAEHLSFQASFISPKCKGSFLMFRISRLIKLVDLFAENV